MSTSEKQNNYHYRTSHRREIHQCILCCTSYWPFICLLLGSTQCFSALSVYVIQSLMSHIIAENCTDWSGCRFKRTAQTNNSWDHPLRENKTFLGKTLDVVFFTHWVWVSGKPAHWTWRAKLETHPTLMLKYQCTYWRTVNKSLDNTPINMLDLQIISAKRREPNYE